MVRRSNREGSIFQRADGYWVASLRTGDGKRVTRYGHSRAEVVRKLQEIQRQRQAGTLISPSRFGLREWVEQWLADLDLRPSSLQTYRSTLTPVLSTIGSMRLDKLSPVLLSSTYAELKKQGGVLAV